MTRINTNVSSLNAQKTLARSNAQLQQSLTRLSTGLRINSGRDDPAGLIASETLRSDIVSTQVAVSNSERANQMITTADSALGQVSSLLNDVRGLVSEAANIGAMSSEQIEANQLQVDSSLEAIDRIAQVTQFQGKRLLDGSLDFISEGVASTISDLQIQQANFGTQTEIALSVNVVAQAEKGSLTYASSTVTTDVVLEIGGTSGFEAFNFAAGSTIAEMASAINLVSDALGISAAVAYDTAAADSTGNVTLSSVGANNDLDVVADTIGRVGGDIDIIFNVVNGGGDTTAASVTNADGSRSITVSLDASDWTKAEDGAAQTVGATTGTLTFDALIAGEDYNGLSLIVIDDAAETAVYDHAAKTMTVRTVVANAAALSIIEGLIEDTYGQLFAVTVATDEAAVAATYDTNVTSGGVDGGVISSTATNVLEALNDDVGTEVTATLTTGNTGATLVTALTDRGFYGIANTGNGSDLNNYLQFLGPDGSSDLEVRFVASGASQSLSIDLVTNPETAGMATGVAQSNADNATFTVTADAAGEAYNNVSIVFTDDSAGAANDPAVAAWDPENKTITITGDFASAAFTATELSGVINNDTVLGGLFTAAVFGSGNGSGLVDVPVVSGSLTMGTLTGGNQYTGVTINLATDANSTITTTAAELVTLVEAGGTGLDTVGISVSHGGTSTGAGLIAAGTATFGSEGTTSTMGYATTTTENATGVNAQVTITAKATGGTYDDIKVNFHHDANVTASTDEYVTYDSDTKELNIYIDSGTSTLQDVLDRLGDTTSAAAAALFSFTAVGTAAGVLNSTDIGGTTAGGLVVDTSSQDGVHMLDNHDEGDILGSTSLTFSSTKYGSTEFVSVKALEGTFSVVDAAGATKTRDSGTDINLRLNGIQAVGKGLRATLNTSALDVSFSLASSVAAGTNLNFRITSGGAQFQLGPDVVSNQQARMGIQSINTAKLGGTSGQLFQIRSGGDYDLTTDTKVAAKIVEQAITSVTTLRGRLGAFQSTTLQSNIDVLNDTLESLTTAESSIRDADFAVESARLTRAQILVQSGISVLSMANQNPQNVLQLLR